MTKADDSWVVMTTFKSIFGLCKLTNLTAEVFDTHEEALDFVIKEVELDKWAEEFVSAIGL